MWVRVGVDPRPNGRCDRRGHLLPRQAGHAMRWNAPSVIVVITLGVRNQFNQFIDVQELWQGIRNDKSARLRDLLPLSRRFHPI